MLPNANSPAPPSAPAWTVSSQSSEPTTSAPPEPPAPPLCEPPPRFSGVQVNSRHRAAGHHHRPRELFLAYVITLTSVACLLGLVVVLFATGTLEPSGVASSSSDQGSPSARHAASSRSNADLAWRTRGRLSRSVRPRQRVVPPRETNAPGLTSGYSVPPDSAWSDTRPPWIKNSGSSTETPGAPFATNVPFAPQNRVDELVLRKLAELQIEPAKLCSDEVFLRRLFIDTLGTLPTAEEARAFLDDPAPDKREKLVEHVLRRPEFADYWAMRWCDVLRVKAEFPIKLWPNAAQAYHRWVREAIKQNMPYDEFARQLLTSSGSNFRTPQVNFYRAVQSKTPEALAGAVALTFLCERTEHWPEERLQGMSVFFSQVAYKGTGEWKEEIVFFDRRQGREEHQDEPLTAVLPNGESVQIPPGQDPRRVFADWLVNKQNPWFARAIANRLWYWLLGRGIVDPPDDVRPENLPSNLPLLNHLGDELVGAEFDLRHLFRVILNSQTYQLACTHEAPGSLAAENFACYSVRRLDAEVLIDAICQITGTSESYSSIIPEPFTFLPEGHRAIALPDGSITSPFLEMFGRPSRDTGLESDRNNRLTARQALHLLNSNHVRDKIKRGPGLRELLSGPASASDRAELLYLTILSRRPTDQERAMAEGLCGSEAGARDVAWALINTDEFLYRH